MLLLQYFSKFRETVISSQAAEKQATMAQCFDTLMNGIDRTLITKNRDGYVAGRRIGEIMGNY